MEFRNPFSRGRVVSVDTEPEEYQRQVGQRGDKGYEMSRSELVEFALCPSRWRKGYRRKDTDALDYGSLLDCLVLQPHRFDERYVIAPANYPATPKKKGDPVIDKPWTSKAKFCQDWEEEQTRHVVYYKDYHQAKKAALSLYEDELIGAFLRASQRSVMVTAQYNDAATGLVIPFKILIDALPAVETPLYGRALGDLKSSESADPRTWPKTIWYYGYHIQTAIYLDIYTAATGEDRTDFFHLIQESYAPYECGHEIVSGDFIEKGREKYMAALTKYAQCLATDKWPSYEPKGRTYHGWAFAEPEPWMMEA